MKINSRIIVSAKVIDNKLVLEWNEAWQYWDELQNSQELADLIAQSEQMLQRSGGDGGGKGKESTRSRDSTDRVMFHLNWDCRCMYIQRIYAYQIFLN